MNLNFGKYVALEWDWKRESVIETKGKKSLQLTSLSLETKVRGTRYHLRIIQGQMCVFFPLLGVYIPKAFQGPIYFFIIDFQDTSSLKLHLKFNLHVHPSYELHKPNLSSTESVLWPVVLCLLLWASYFICSFLTCFTVSRTEPY